MSPQQRQEAGDPPSGQPPRQQDQHEPPGGGQPGTGAEDGAVQQQGGTRSPQRHDPQDGRGR